MRDHETLFKFYRYSSYIKLLRLQDDYVCLNKNGYLQLIFFSWCFLDSKLWKQDLKLRYNKQ